MNNFTIRIAGNTEAPCYWAIKEKGYDIQIVECFLTNKEGTDCRYLIEAKKEHRLFSATDVYELFALISMWEVRGDNWQVSKEEISLYFDLKDKAPLFDMEGNELEND
ncbi:hypothetical protein [Flavobacterium collinsii]|uniref:Phage protein n=1 Tax=Flavobacterium collinsii TaxID=1114861 RepID=A0ABN7EEY0_9FLAO|nr:hypothetical protein [Flavobacterium collinsii]CAA9195168.1 hypothetical protein FLACOL7796_00491 [Flavobacterium collinsii]